MNSSTNETNPLAFLERLEKTKSEARENRSEGHGQSLHLEADSIEHEPTEPEPESTHDERAGPKTKADTDDAAYFSQLPHDTVRNYMEVLGAVKWGVYQYVLTFRNIHSRLAYPSLPTIAEGTGVSVSSVQRALTTLYGKDGLLKAHGLPPLLTRAKHEPDSESDKSRKRGGKPVNEYRFPVYEKDLARIARFTASEKKSKP